MYITSKSVKLYKPNYERKAKVLELGLDKQEREFKRGINQASKDVRNELIQAYVEYQDDPLWVEAQRVNKAAYGRRTRLTQKIENFLMSGGCIFLTLTFNDDTLSSTSEETRRRYVTRYLKLFSNKYIANIDYGGKCGREHYHAVVQCDMVDNKKWLYGAINFERVRQTSDANKLAKYVLKLTNHAIKNTVRRNYTIYSRNI